MPLFLSGIALCSTPLAAEAAAPLLLLPAGYTGGGGGAAVCAVVAEGAVMRLTLTLKLA